MTTKLVGRKLHTTLGSTREKQRNGCWKARTTVYLHETPVALSQLVRTTAREYHMSEPHVLKDYYATMILKELTSRYPDLVFKGGTCLSKCYKAIDRFSEDVELGFPYEEATEEMQEAIEQAVVASAEAMGLAIVNLDATRSGRDCSRYDISIRGRRDRLIVETAVMTPACPFETKPLQSFIGQLLAEWGRDDLLQLYELEAFNVLANSLERTFVDKVFAICDYFLVSNGIPPRQSRHIYDLHKLVGLVSLDENMASLFAQVREQRKGSYRCPSAEEGASLPDILDDILKSDSYRSDYNNVTLSLLYEDVSYEEAIQSLARIRDFLRGHKK